MHQISKMINETTNATLARIKNLKEYCPEEILTKIL